MRLGRVIICLLMLVTGLFSARAQQLTWNLEWGFTGTMYSVHDIHYTTQEGYHMDPRYIDASFHANGLVGFQAGIRANRRLQLDLCTGYYGIQQGIRSIPAGMRISWNFGKHPETGGITGFAEGGFGLSDASWKRRSEYARMGGGYRFLLGSGLFFKVFVSGQLSLAHPIPYDPFDDMFVDPSRLSRSNRFSAAFSVSAAIGF